MSIKRYCYAFWISGSISLSCLTTTSFAQAQTIEADPTLTPNNSIVTPQPNNISEISGGLEVGRNLFHSFREFSVPKGNTAYFNNADSIQNIISRVTGGSVSNIDGLIRANGTANLFLLNPNGIIFGPNAKLDIGGSFLASTASSLLFSDGSFFSATETQTTPLLTISIPIGLQYRTNAARIVNSSAAGFQVQPGNTLALVGGNVQLDGGILEAPAGRAELGGLAGSGTVGLRVNGNNLSLSFPDGVALADVLLTDKARVGVASDGGGHIAINARNLDISGGSELLAGIGNGLGSVGTQAGDIAINATGAVTVTNSVISNDVESGATGNGGNINVKAGSLSLNNNSRLQARTFGQGNAGSVLIQADDFVDLVNTSVVRSNVETGAQGAGGKVDIQARALSLLGGSQLQAVTRGQGNAGNVSIAVQDAITVAGEGTITVPGDVASAIYTNVEGVEGAEGNGGNIDITTGSLLLSDGGQLLADTDKKGNAGNIFVSASESVSLSSSTLENGTLIRSSVGAGADGNGGKIEIQTRSLSLAGGAQIAASVLESQNGLPGGQGKGGDILINATETVNLSGAGVRGFSSGLVAATEEGAKGSAGNITVNTGSFRIADGAVVSAQTSNKSNGGNITINATTFEVVNGGQILTTASSSGNAGNITLQSQSITAQGIFGTQSREQRTEESDITPISALGPEFNGIPENVVAPAALISQNPCARGAESEFTITGRGGLPPSPNDALTTEATGVGLVEPAPMESRGAGEQRSRRVQTLPPGTGGRQLHPAGERTGSTPSTPKPIMPAQGWVFNALGEVVLTAYNPTVTGPQRLQRNSGSCLAP